MEGEAIRLQCRLLGGTRAKAHMLQLIKLIGGHAQAYLHPVHACAPQITGVHPFSTGQQQYRLQ